MEYQNKRNKTKAKIEGAFIELYREKDISHITVREICRLAEINRSTFYTFFLDVYDLKEKIETEQMELLAGKFAEIMDKMQGPINFNIFVETIIRHGREYDYLPFLFVRRGNEEFVDRVASYAKGIMSGRFGQLDEETERLIDFCMRYHITGLAAFLNKWEEEQPHRQVEEAINLLGNIANKGVVTVVWENIGEQTARKPLY